MNVLQRGDCIVVQENCSLRYGGCPIAEAGDLIHVQSARPPRSLTVDEGPAPEGVLFVHGYTSSGKEIFDWLTFDKLEPRAEAEIAS